ncbi:hypothetical protein KXX16_005754 [Aspergillus fumigatus]|uniref:Uncharacterized protein n=1 Tax=Aspergillus fumigatus TaxID=746128 RepID=A0A8H4I1Y7_ASPFM|nr:hypothetical protein CNMCM8689_005114 [Aspergillus fumigatus]KAF4284405.1 hypothetical protein CNMCM8686_005379 [Aspergillus fumigatus]KAH1268111.1 hypothetical protein KXX45_005234 [Aspergillus fumigatus]KAH1301442.1 hypothetical protein KXX66_005571 [Aspergillus fumigatus]KAH1310124.1 hypothetical protein KXX47_006726 [Aspergillus fumigatus]
MNQSPLYAWAAVSQVKPAPPPNSGTSSTTRAMSPVTSPFNLDRFYHPTGSHHGTTNIRQAYLLSEDVRAFDAKFFSVPPGDAEAIDPQQRLLLEVTYEALESSGHTLADLSNSNTGAFVGLMSQDYFALNGQDVDSVPTYAASGTAASNASSRLSYFFNWHGPSMAIDTACSSNLVAVNEAVQALRNGTSRVAVACGTNLCLSAFTFITLNGYARGEGVACVVLKTLSDAISDRDPIEAVTREVGVNHDGRTKGLTMPSAKAQAALIRNTYARAGLDPTKEADRCQYFEAHGTGTKAGVNSFGLGGTNAHCILETYNPPTASDPVIEIDMAASGTCCIPSVFSAASDRSLATLLQSTLKFMDENTDVNMSGLAYNLSTKRSALQRRLAVSATSIDELRDKIKSTIEAASENDATLHSTSALPEPASLLGIFTGQGAQWQGMGSQLISSIPLARRTKIDSTTPVGKASLSQPLCTAVQVILVDMLRAAGVKFQAVVGHSSGEIAAAYAAGFISAWDAIRIADYRGFYAEMAAAPGGEKGAMLAAGTSFEDASDLCQLDDFAGRICVAAHNSPSSVTLSGDIDAIALARRVLEEEEKFARRLKVDTAYHSTHMHKCSVPYLTALRNCNIQVQQPGPDAPQWFSSVRNGQVISSMESLDSQYWVDNMVQPELFCPAVQTCLKYVDKAINCVVEVGPHPALQGPAKDSILAAVDREIPYTGTLNRGKSSTVAFSDALRFLWCLFGSAAVTLGAFQQTNYPDTPTTMTRGLPTYPWTHDRGYFAESRLIKTFHNHPLPFHDLLGIQTADGAREEWGWRNILKMNELKWLSEHSV